jgi:hypothetical protein
MGCQGEAISTREEIKDEPSAKEDDGDGGSFHLLPNVFLSYHGLNT